MTVPETKRNIQISLPCTGIDEWEACREPLESGWLTHGPKVAAFEKAFAVRHKCNFALATTSCTTALHLALATLGIGPGDEVIVPAFTWVATANAVLYCGATPIFADVDRDTYNIAPKDIEKRITKRTKAIIPVHLFGLCSDIDAIRTILPPDVHIIEDAACAAGASYKGAPAGGLGDFAAFSFHPRKSITTGEGGMLTTNNTSYADTANMLRNHGASVSEEQRHHGPRPYLLPEFNLLGFNYRMTDLQGAVGLVQLGKLDQFLAERRKRALQYQQALAGIPWLSTPSVPSDSEHAWQAFVTYINPETAPLPRNEIMDRLQKAGIATRPGTHAVHMLGYYRDRLGLQADDYPAARDCDANTMAIPLHNRMSDADYEHVISSLRSIA